MNYYSTANNATNTSCLAGNGGYEKSDKESSLKEYQKRLLKSIEKRTMKNNFDSIGTSNAMEPTSIQADDLKRQRVLNRTPYKSPNKREKSPLIEKY